MADPKQSLAAMVKAKYPGVYDDIADAELDAKVRAKYPGVYDDIPKPSAAQSQAVVTPQAQSSVGGIIGQAVASAVPAVASGAMTLSKSPTLAKTTGAIANGLTTGAGVIHGMWTGNIPEVLAAPMEGWAAGKGGYWLGKLSQKLMLPAAKVAEHLAPYAQALSTWSGAQGVLDLAQMLEPNRKDIGVLGVTVGNGRTDAEKAANPALVNQIVDGLADKWHQFMGDYPKELGKQSWNALNPSQRLDAFHTFMQQQTGGGK